MYVWQSLKCSSTIILEYLLHIVSNTPWMWWNGYSLDQRVRMDFITGKSLSEALIFASTNLQYDNRLFVELQVQYMKIPSSNLGRTCCEQFLNTTCSPHVLQKEELLTKIYLYKSVLNWYSWLVAVKRDLFQKAFFRKDSKETGESK